MNLQTGKKEAKLMDYDNTYPQHDRTQTQTFSKQSVKELKEALRLLQGDNFETTNNKVENKFRSIEDIKEEFESLNMKMVTEEQIMEELLTKFSHKDISLKQQADILLELENYVHKYDNAVEFSKMGGIQKAILSLNSTDEDLRTASAFLLGTAMQSNPKIQVLALDNGAMQMLLHHLATDSSRSVQIKCLYALSCMIRQFPFAQKTFLELGGLSVLGGFFSNSEADVEKLQIKSVALLYDIIMENELVHRHSSSVGVTTDGKLLQYAQVNIKEAIKQFELCPRIPRLLSVTDHDTREKVVMLMSVLVDICWESFFEWTNHIQSLQKQYNNLALKETESDDTFYFSHIRDVIDDILRNLHKFASGHDEL